MEENVALDSSRQHLFIKSIKGIKKFMKKKSSNVEKVSTDLKPNDEKRKKKAYHGKGLVYLSHIPHGFYEHQMTQYFKQFGRVTNARVIRSKRTGNSKGCAFVEFSEPSVGQIVAETMNNYLMGKRLLKAVYIPPEKQRRNVFRKNWTSLSNPGADLRKKLNKSFNAVKTEEQYAQKARKLHSRLLTTKKKLSEIGIDYNFFNAVDVPQFIIDTLNYKKEEGGSVVPKAEITQPIEKSSKKNKDNKVKEIKSKSVTVEPESAVNPSEIKKKTKNVKKVDLPKIIPMANFISLKKNEEGDQSDDDASDFDSDEYMRNLATKSSDENESDVGSPEIVNERKQPTVKGNSKKKVLKQTFKQKKGKLNGNTKSSGFSNVDPAVPKESKKSKKNKNPPVAGVTSKKRKVEKEVQEESSRFSKKENKSGAMKIKKAKK